MAANENVESDPPPNVPGAVEAKALSAQFDGLNGSEETVGSMPWPEFLRQSAQAILTRRGIRGRVLFCCAGGSTMYNLRTPKSDVDIIGVFSAHPDILLGMEPELFPDSITNSPKYPVSMDEPDHLLHEVGKFCKLLSIGNFHALDLFFISQGAYESPEWTEFKKSRNLFVTKNAVEQQLNYITSVVHKAEKGMADKALCQLLRIGLSARSIIIRHKPMVWIETTTEGEFSVDRQTLMDVKEGRSNLTIADILRQAEETRDYIREALSKRPPALMPPPNLREHLSQFLLQIRYDDIISEAQSRAQARSSV